MLRSVVETTEQMDSCNSGSSKPHNNYSEHQNPDNNGNNTVGRPEAFQSNDFFQHSPNQRSSPMPVSESCTSNSQQNTSPSLPSESMHLSYPSPINFGRPGFSYTSTLPSSSSSSSSTMSSLIHTTNVLPNTRLTNIPPSFHSVANRNLSLYNTATNNNININNSSSNNNISNMPNNNLMTTITKKAKCHFCGKPFANKGQVRLHISKNKCPCLLQQSCHVAALAAAFGSNNNNNISKIPQSVGTMKSASVSSQLSSVAYKRNNNNSGNNGNNNNVHQNFTDPMHNFGSSQIRSIAKDELTNAPSALSLLKERFQNFDVNQNPVNYSCFSPYLPTNISSSLDFSCPSSSVASASSSNNFLHSNKISTPPPPSSSIANMSWLGTTNNTSSFSPSQPNKDTDIMNNSLPGSASAAAVNAGHLAAMALLAQTLVQLTTATQSAPASHPSLPPVMCNVNNSSITPQKAHTSEICLI
ncbi:unnamed protein product [Heterobilharzia americana]|nr:unnamed protein product [Heterobilharzia americana]